MQTPPTARGDPVRFEPSSELRDMIAPVFVRGAKPRGRPIPFARDCEALLGSARVTRH